MMLGVGLAAVVAAQTIGATALWPTRPATRQAKKGLLPLKAEEKNELVQENRDLRQQLTVMTRDRDRLSQNEAAAIEKRDEYLAERDDLKIRCDDLLKECKRLRKASVRSEIQADDKD